MAVEPGAGGGALNSTQGLVGRPGRLVAVAYVALLLVSHGVRGRAVEPTPPAGSSVLDVAAVRGDRFDANRRVRLVYTDLSPANGRTTPILVIHGSPGRRSQLRRFSQALAESARVVVPDLPGFGDSTASIPDYSIRAHAGYLHQLIDGLGLSRVHLVGFSMGGGVALHLAEMLPERVASLTLLSSIGAQEYELLGSYELNHAIHWLQLAGLWAILEGTPHMGALDGGELSLAYARNFSDTDQRPLRGILSRLPLPTLIVHGATDGLVPIEAAYEHRRLVPQSELVTYDADHFLPFRMPVPLADVVRRFTNRVERGTAVTRAHAAAERLQAAAQPAPAGLPPARGITIAVLALLLAVATLVSEDLACLGAGMLVAQGRLTFGVAVASVGTGIVVGDVMLFLAGRAIGRSRLASALRRRVLPPDVEARTAAWLATRGAFAVFASRFLPGTRLPTYVAAGWLGMRFGPFLWWFLLAAAIWTPLVVGVGALPTSVLMAIGMTERPGLLATGALLLVLAILLRLLLAACTYRGRRGFVSCWRRWTRWEFWPPWLAYPPVLLYVAWQMIRHRGVTVFTAANPAIVGGGFVGESKSAILRLLTPVTDAVAPFVVLDGRAGPDVNLDAARQFAATHGLPVVCKPDQGQRGSGVVIARTIDALERAVSAIGGETILQTYVPGVEFGVFYVRHPDEGRGRLISITEKRLPVLIGDGRRTLERLILDDDRAVAMARLYLRLNAARCDWAPMAGEHVQLSELGTHCRGAIFLDGGAVRTPALEAAVDAIASRVPGFYFGRFDVRAESETALREGRFRILELNGVTSEATHIYDPALSIGAAYRTLFEQWRLAFEIGAENERRGVRPTSLRELIRLATAYRRVSRSHLQVAAGFGPAGSIREEIVT
jgi:pimeloyl-ACP methyl ester carboxylesterase/membrane protein DedA with SNARE-associated domain